MAYSYTVNRKYVELTAADWATIATSSTGNGTGGKHVVILNGQMFLDSEDQNDVLLRFDGTSTTAQWYIVLAAGVGVGKVDLPVLVADAGYHIEAKLATAERNVQCSVQYAEVEPIEAQRILHNANSR